VYYVEHFSLWLDIRILYRTIGVVLLGEQRYSNNTLVDIVNHDSERIKELVAKNGYR